MGYVLKPTIFKTRQNINLMMEMKIIVVLYFHLLTLAFSQSSEGIRPQESLEASTRAQDTTLIRELSRLLLNFDDAFYRITAPKVEFEQNVEQQKVRNMPDPIRSYFDRVRENYRSLQSKIGSTFDASEGNFKMPNVFDINFQNKGSKSVVGVSLPFLPLNIQVNAKSAIPSHPISSDEIEQKPTLETSSQVPIYNSVVDYAKDGDNNKESGIKESLIKDSSEIPEDFQKRSGKRQNHQIPIDRALGQNNRGSKTKPAKVANDHLKFSSPGKENKPLETDSDIQGRILGDLLYSESTFDRYFRSILKNFKWLVDPSIFPPKELVENIRGITGQLSAASKKTDHQKDVFISNIPQKISSDSKPGIQDIEVRKSKPMKRQNPLAGTRLNLKPKIIVAFTPEGIPLKLKIDTQSKNSLKFLHETLSAAGLSLNIPIESDKHIQPVGSDILQLGSVPKGMETQALYVDITDKKQLKSFLKNLRKFKTNV